MALPRPHSPHSRRIRLWDALRGWSVISMVAFHGCYDLMFLYGVFLAFFQPPWIDIWRASIAWVFLFIAGVMCSFSKNNIRRGLIYLAVSAAIYVVTLIVAVDDPISFGIIFCIAAATLIDGLLAKVHMQPKTWRAIVILAIAFLITYNIPRGYIGFGEFRLMIPDAFYDTGLLAWAGFPGPAFVSGDYYPLMPFAFMYGIGVASGRLFLRYGYRRWFLDAHCRPLEFVGRHSLLIYILHQPILIGLMELFQ